jgi:hypothetical protein
MELKRGPNKIDPRDCVEKAKDTAYVKIYRCFWLQWHGFVTIHACFARRPKPIRVEALVARRLTTKRGLKSSPSTGEKRFRQISRVYFELTVKPSFELQV